MQSDLIATIRKYQTVGSVHYQRARYLREFVTMAELASKFHEEVDRNCLEVHLTRWKRMAIINQKKSARAYSRARELAGFSTRSEV